MAKTAVFRLTHAEWLMMLEADNPFYLLEGYYVVTPPAEVAEPVSLDQVLSDLLREHDLCWSGESEYPIEPISLTDQQLEGWQYLPGAYQLVWQQQCKIRDSAILAGWASLWCVLKERDMLAFRRTTKELSVYDLVIVVREAQKWCGLQTKFIQP